MSSQDERSVMTRNHAPSTHRSALCGLAILVSLALGCVSGVEAPAPPKPNADAPVLVTQESGRWLVASSRPTLLPDGDRTVTILGGRRARLAPDGAIELERAASPEPLGHLLKVPKRDGSWAWLGATERALYRFDDPLGDGRRIATLPPGTYRLSPVVDGVFVVHDDSTIYDVTTGEARSPAVVGALRPSFIGFSDASKGIAVLPTGTLETSDGGASWQPSSRRHFDNPGIEEGQFVDLRSSRRLKARDATASPTLAWLREKRTDPLFTAATEGVRVDPRRAVIADGRTVALVDLETGVVLGSADAPAHGCRPARDDKGVLLLACDEAVAPVTVTDAGIRIDGAKRVARASQPVVSADGGMLYMAACMDDEAAHADDPAARRRRFYCVRQPSGGFATVVTDDFWNAVLPRPDGTVIVFGADEDPRRERSIMRLAPGKSPVHLAEATSCADGSSLALDAAPDGAIIAYGVADCSAKVRAWSIITLRDGRSSQEKLEADCLHVDRGRVVARRGDKALVRRGSEPLSVVANDIGSSCPRVSELGFAFGDHAYIGWDVGPVRPRTDEVSAAQPTKANTSSPARLECTSVGAPSPSTDWAYPALPCGKDGAWLGPRGELLGPTACASNGSWSIRYRDHFALDAAVKTVKLQQPREATPLSREARQVLSVETGRALGDRFAGTLQWGQQWFVVRSDGVTTEVKAGRAAELPSRHDQLVLADDGTFVWSHSSDQISAWPRNQKGPVVVAHRGPPLLLLAEPGAAVLVQQGRSHAASARLALGGAQLDTVPPDLFQSVPELSQAAVERAAACAPGVAGRRHRLPVDAVVTLDGKQPKTVHQRTVEIVRTVDGVCVSGAVVEASYADGVLGTVRADLRRGSGELMRVIPASRQPLSCTWTPSR
jgi:hypothetical protein